MCDYALPQIPNMDTVLIETTRIVLKGRCFSIFSYIEQGMLV
jgi:hypothetical protein